MINRYSSRRVSLSDSLLNEKLKDAKSYDRIAGYFSSSILEVAGESIADIDGKIRIICNSHLDSRDVATAKVALDAVRQEWCSSEPEELTNSSQRFKKLYHLLSTGKMEVRIIPDDRFGLMHGKAGVITLANGDKTSFLGSANESFSGWKLNYELIWEDNSKEAVDWVQEEFDSLWNDDSAIPLPEFVIGDIKRTAERKLIETVEDWQNEESEVLAPAVAVESPVYRKELGLWEHQKNFIDKAFNDHKKPYGARYILADEVGLGKTIQLAMSAQLMAIYGDRPILIIVPKTLTWQWQEEIDNLLDMPSAVWDGKKWIDENGHEHVGSITKCPRRTGIISQGLIVSKSESVNELLNLKYECVIVDECHRARRRNLGKGKEHNTPDPNNLYDYLLQLSPKTKSMLLATATPIQMHAIELWDLMSILSKKNDSVLGSPAAYWRKRSKISLGLNLITGKEESDSSKSEDWEWIRNPFPPSEENTTFATLRQSAQMPVDEFVFKKSYGQLREPDKQRVGDIITRGFYQKYNPYIRHVVRRERKYLEETYIPGTDQTYLPKIKVELHGENDADALILTGYLKDAYEYASEFCKVLAERSRGAGFLKTLLLRRIGSSIEAGRNTGKKMLMDWNTYVDDAANDDDYEDYLEEVAEVPSEVKNLTQKETVLLRKYVRALESTNAEDPKYQRIVELLRDWNWIERGTIIFSQYFDTTRWIAENLSVEFDNEIIGLYAGGSKSGIYVGGQFKTKDKETIKAKVKAREIRILVGTDSASEGLNLQTLGSLINIDLPWNPTKLEQRKGRIQRIGQQYDTIHIYNMRYKDSIEDRVHSKLSERLKNISDVFGQVPDVLEDVWIDVALNQEEEALKLIDAVPEKHPFELRYRQDLDHIDWESCSKVLDNKERKNELLKGW